MKIAFYPPLLALAGVFVSGCGGTGTQVSGTVIKADDSPLVDANVVARSEATGKSFYGTSDQSGRFELRNKEIPGGLMPGNYQVTVAENLETSDGFLPPTIPQKYSSYDAAGLSFRLDAGETKVFDIRLEAMQAVKGRRR